MADKPIWERLDSDTAKSYAAFCTYRDMGSNRSLEKVGKALGKSGTLIERWSSTHDWVNRATAYDEYQQKLDLIRLEQARVKIRSDALKDYEALRKAIDKRLELIEENDYKGSPSDFQTLIALMERLNAYARLNTGLPDKITSNTNTNDNKVTGKITLLSQLSDDELDDLLTG